MTQSIAYANVTLPPARGLPAVSKPTLLALLMAALPCLVMIGCGQEEGHSRAPDRQAMVLGHEVYNRQNSCALCHQENGIGKYKQFPPLSRNSNVNAEDPERLIKAVSHGMIGELNVDGRTFNGAMTAWNGLLTDEEIAAVLTYVRNSWGNQAPAVSAEQVAKVQGQYKDRKLPWTVTELETGVAAGPLEIAFDENEDPIQLGRTVYMTEGMCGSCHQPEGQGVPGSYPPLAGSEWVQGDRDRLIKIALQGLSGTIERGGIEYSNEMPAQGALLDDRLMAAALTYIRSAWGNTSDAIHLDEVAAIRKRYAKLDHPWPVETLAAQDKQSPLKNLRYTVVPLDPSWDKLPALNELEPIATGTLEDNYIRINLPGDVPTVDPKKGGYAIVFEADLEVTSADTYNFALEAQNAGALFINDELVVNQQKVSRWLSRGNQKIDLPVGTHKLRVHYAQTGKRGKLGVSWLAPTLDRNMAMMTPGTTNAVLVSNPELLLKPKDNRAVVHRGRYEHQSPEGLGIGYTERVNLSYDAKRMQWNMLWLGDFVNAGNHWVGRNEMYAVPSGNDILRLALQPPLAELNHADADWPKDAGLRNSPAGYRFKGYKLNPRGEPTFRYTFNGLSVTDEPKPIKRADGVQMQRTVTVQTQANQAAPDSLYHLVATGETITEQNGVHTVDKLYTIRLPQGVQASLRQQGGNQQLIAPATFKTSGENQVAEWRYTFTWLAQ